MRWLHWAFKRLHFVACSHLIWESGNNKCLGLERKWGGFPASSTQPTWMTRPPNTSHTTVSLQHLPNIFAYAKYQQDILVNAQYPPNIHPTSSHHHVSLISNKYFCFCQISTGYFAQITWWIQFGGQPNRDAINQQIEVLFLHGKTRIFVRQPVNSVKK